MRAFIFTTRRITPPLTRLPLRARLDQPSRRDLSTGAAAGVGLGLGPLPAAAKGSKALCLPGYNLAEAGTDGFTVGLEHATPDWNKWHDILKGFGPDLLSVYPPEAGVIREFFVKTTAVEGGDGVLAGLVFADRGCPPSRSSAARRPVRDAGPRGLGHRQVARNYYKGDSSAAPPGPPPAPEGQGVVYGTRGLGIKYGGGLRLGRHRRSTSRAASPRRRRAADRQGELGHEGEEGVGVVHFTKTFKGAQKFEADIGGPGTLTARRTPTRCMCARAR